MKRFLPLLRILAAALLGAALFTKALVAFNERVTKDPRVENVLLPLRDGLMLIRKK